MPPTHPVYHAVNTKKPGSQMQRTCSQHETFFFHGLPGDCNEFGIWLRTLQHLRVSFI